MGIVERLLPLSVSVVPEMSCRRCQPFGMRHFISKLYKHHYMATFYSHGFLFLWFYRFSYSYVEEMIYLQLDTKKTLDCSGHPVLFVQTNQMQTCKQMKTCDWLERLTNEESCYIQCRCQEGEACMGEVLILPDNPDHYLDEWMFCSLILA